MNKIKSFDEFVNENLVTKGVYNHYGPGSLRPLVMKLLGEGKNPQIVRTYLSSIGVEPWRIQKVFDEIEYSVAIENKVNEASKFKGKEIYPDWVSPNQMKGMIKNIKDLTKGALYAILEPGMDVWQAEYEYAGKVGPMHLFKSTAQGTNDENDLEFTDSELKDAIKHVEIALMESLNEGKNKMTFEEKANKFLSTLNEEEDDVNEGKKEKPTFEQAAAAFLLGLAGSDAVEEKLNKDTLQVEGDGEDVDDMIDDLDDGDEDEYQGPDDEAPDSDDDDDDSDLEKAVATAKKDKKKLDRIKSILAEATAKGEVEIEGDGDEVELKVSADDEETGDEIEIEGPEEE